MGLDASNARMQTLVARLSDIHFQGQQINNQRLLIAASEEQLSSTYSTALDQTELVVTDATGNQNPLTQANLLAAGNAVVTENDGQTINLGGISNTELSQGLKDGKFQVWDLGSNGGFSYNAGGAFCDATGAVSNLNAASGSTTYAEANGVTEYNWNSTMPTGAESPIQSVADTDGQEEAQMKYDSELGQLQPEDKALEMQLKDFDTQAQAIQTEIDSVKKVIDKDIELTFKTFGNG